MTFEIFSSRIRFDFSFFAVLTLMLLTAQKEIVIVCVVSSLLHECGHLVLLCVFKEKTESVVFGAFGIRIDRAAVSTLSYKKEAAVASGGVIVNFILAGIFYVVFNVNESQTAFFGVFVNLFIAALNCMPVSVLDSGNFLRYILLVHFDEEKVAAVMHKVSDITTVLFTLFCVWFTLCVSLNISLIAVCVYLIVLNIQERWK